jgi:hypothetical protein
MNPEHEFLTIEEACRFIGGESHPIHSATLRRGVKAGRFSPPVKIGPEKQGGGIRWLRSELLNDIQRLMAKRDRK